MDDTLRNLFLSFTRQHKQNNLHKLSTDDSSTGTALSKSVARPHISLKARMLGGHAKKIVRLGGSLR
jgi:hypothetical protein